MQQLPPHDPQAERAVLGAVLRDGRRLDDVATVLKPDHFYFDAHQKLFTAMLALGDRNKPIDSVTVAEEIGKRGQAADIGGWNYLAELLDASPTTAAAATYARIVIDNATRRALIHAATEILRSAYHPDGETEEVVGKAESLIFKVAEGGQLGEAVDLNACLRSAFDAIDDRFAGNRLGMPIGYLDLDKILSGFHRKELTVIAARPSVGKTALAVNLVRNLAREGHAVHFASLEQAKDELAERLACCESEVNLYRVRSATASQEELRQLHAAAAALVKGGAVFIDDAPNQTVSRIAAHARRLKRKHNLAAVIVDYLQLIPSDDKKQNREQEVASISRRLKWLAKELDVAVIALSQLNRKSEERTENRPRLSDLRESGAIEQDADNVWLLWRGNEQGAVIGVDVAKQRNGPTGVTGLVFLKHCMRFENHAGLLPWNQEAA